MFSVLNCTEKDRLSCNFVKSYLYRNVQNDSYFEEAKALRLEKMALCRADVVKVTVCENIKI